MLGPGKKATVGNVAIGAQVWVEDAELAWVEAEVIEIDGEKVKVRTIKGSEVTTNISSVYAKDPNIQSGGPDDISKLTYLHEPAVLHILASRYELGEIYTNTGNILIAVNPFVKLPHMYNNHAMEQYRRAPFGELSPHVFAVADASYRAMVTEKRSQSILVSGESGAGKTVTIKLILQYLAYMGGLADTDGPNVEQKVLESISLLEAFGNAKVGGVDSSRFGKFVEIQYDRSGRVSGAAVRTYLLERSRVVQIADPERNYHCFYQLCASPEEAVFRVIASLLHLGNVDFISEPVSDSSQLKDGKSMLHLEAAADLLRCESKGLLDSICTQNLVTRDGNITMTLRMEQASANRDILVTTIYSRLFGWLVDKVNIYIGQDPDSSFFVGLLDIHAFDSFKFNSFEQFNMNLANEKLQQHFNQHVFMREREYTEESINCSHVEFVDNQDVLDLIENPAGIIAHLDEACMSSKSTNETCVNELFQQFSNHKRLSKPELTRNDFLIKHSAGDVTYQTERFLDENKDYVAEQESLLGSSSCSFVSSLFPRSADEASKSSCKFSSISTQIKHQLEALMDTLNSTEPRYIRCVKPNMLNMPGRLENQAVIRQLRRGGVMEAIRCCAEYSIRLTFCEFLDRYGLLAPEVLDGIYDVKLATEAILIKANLWNYQLGKTKVFLRSGQLAELDGKRAEMSSNAATDNHRLDLIAMLRAAVTIQKYWRGTLARQKYLETRVAHKQYQLRGRAKAATVIQARWRGFKARSQYKKLRKGAITFQCAWRGRVARRELKKFKSVSPGALKLILEYCRFHRVPGRSDKERKVFDEKFVRLDTRRLCELTSAADSLDMKPLGDLTSRALARMIEGKTPEQIREIFHLPDDLTEEEKLEPVKMSTDDPRIRLLNRLYARKRKELQEKKLLKSNTTDSTMDKQIKDERSVEELVSFIDGENKINKVGKTKKKKNRRKKGPTDESPTVASRPQTDPTSEAVDHKPESEKIVRGLGRSNPRARGATTSILEHHNRLLRDQDKVFEEGNYDDDGIDPALKEIVDREVEDFARRLNSDWLKRTQEILTLASPRHEDTRVLNSSFDDNNGPNSFHLSNRSNGNVICDLPEDNR